MVPATPAPPVPVPVGLAPSAPAPVVYRLPLAVPVVFVTIDDGWFRDPRVITFVQQSRWPVSVFLIEQAALEAPSYFKQLQVAGAVIEDHTFDHPQLPTLALAGQQLEICRPAHDYVGLFGQAPTLLRPPYGAWNPLTQQAARACGMTAVVEWSATMADGRLRVAGPRLRGGDIILLHFRPHLYADLIALRQILAGSGLAVGRLESYLSPPPAGAPTTTTSSTTTAPTTTTTTTAPPPTSTTRPTTTTSTTRPTTTTSTTPSMSTSTPTSTSSTTTVPP